MSEANETLLVQVELRPEVVAELRQRAQIAKMTLEKYLEELAEEDTGFPGRPSPIEEAIKKMNSRTEEQILADRERILKTARRGRPLPPGKTICDVVEGTWPGDETDEEINQILKDLS